MCSSPMGPLSQRSKTNLYRFPITGNFVFSCTPPTLKRQKRERCQKNKENCHWTISLTFLIVRIQRIKCSCHFVKGLIYQLPSN